MGADTIATLTMRVILVLLVCAAGLLAQQNYSPGEVADGARLFRITCAACHGPDGDRVAGVDLGHDKFRRTSSDEGLIEIIQKGITGTAMPPHAFTHYQAEAVVAYLHSVATSGRTVTGDAAQGRAIFEGKGGCMSCHRVNGNGSRVGPDLSDIGKLRRAVEIEQSLVAPNDEILPQNRSFRAVTRGGQMITGRLLNQDMFSIQIIDSNEKLLSLKRADLREAEFLKDSPMPSYRDKLSSTELANLVAYLASLKGF
jgi:putative heme-binding domain-containing protein